MKEFNGKVALVTGAASGIGKATAMAFAHAGASVVLSDVSLEGERVAVELRDRGAKAAFINCDVSKKDQVEALIQKTVQQFGRLDYAFNNAGIEGVPASTSECSEENWNRTIDVNLKGVWLCMKYEIQQMLKARHGAIVNCSSIAGLVGFPNIPAYSASKHGVLGLTKTAALELAKTGIRVNAVCPGVIWTPMIERFTKGNKETETQLITGAPMGRMGQPEEIAATVLWLCSDEASFITGHPLTADGGWVAQ